MSDAVTISSPGISSCPLNFQMRSKYALSLFFGVVWQRQPDERVAHVLIARSPGSPSG